MKLETILNAMVKSRRYLIVKAPTVPRNIRGKRQYYAFRDRILRMFDTVHEYYEGLLDEGDEVNRQQIRRIAELEKENEQLVVLSEDLVKKKDKRIAELEEQLMIEKEFGMHYHAEFMKLFEKGVE